MPKKKKTLDASKMFENCTSLISLPYISFLDTYIFTNMHRMFKGCSSLKILPDISKWNTK